LQFTLDRRLVEPETWWQREVGVIIDGVWIGDLIYSQLIPSQLMTTLYRSLTHMVSSVYYRFH
jgi:hypothetical protein